MTKPICPQCESNDIALVTYHQVTKVTEAGKITKSKTPEDEHFLCYDCDTECDLETLVESTFSGDEEAEEDEDEDEARDDVP